ncbi:hypothetical protein Q9295_05970 [Xinfangfangia sp. CPCC 101601]|uniref:Protein ImuA n=1 Tax=Pseudogemmobacter lacusdianii TaxID=3069608 RepID=A0ABU0VW12_9RHOB|nr:hypothetical protein [Xinfangfangia sp. CPCC 101601]MDQ2065909.1 hypothetical protein [Xinfangfangia sp. CPCC 101601]
MPRPDPNPFPPALAAPPLGAKVKASATLSEVFAAPGGEAAALGFVMARLEQAFQERAQIKGRAAAGSHKPAASDRTPKPLTPILWLQERMVWREAGRPYLPGLGPRPLLLMQLSRPADILIAAEEGLNCNVLAGVVAELRGNPSALSFTALKRLALRAEASGVPCWLIRQSAEPGLSAARERWRIAPLPSDANPDDPRAPGTARWKLELFRSRDARPGEWEARHERTGESDEGRAPDHLDLVAAIRDGTLAETGAATRRRGFG